MYLSRRYGCDLARVVHLEVVAPQLGRADLELELRLGDALLDLRLLLGQQLDLVLPLLAPALVLGLRARRGPASVSFLLITFSTLGGEGRGDVAEHLAAELQRSRTAS